MTFSTTFSPWPATYSSYPPILSHSQQDSLKQCINMAQGTGKPLPPTAKKKLEAAFQIDLSAIRIHSGVIAHTLTRLLHADAFACGTDIFFAEGKYAPDTKNGLRLLAHEITHVLQQAQQRIPVTVHNQALQIHTADDIWEVEANQMADKVIAGQTLSLANEFTWTKAQPTEHLIIQCHDSFEHRVLGDLFPNDLYAISMHTSGWQEIVNRQLQLLWLWHQNPEAVTEAQINDLCPWIRTLRLNTSGLLVTYGELNALPDYIATPMVADTISKEILLPILQFIRQEGYIQLNKLLGNTVSEHFQYAVYTPSSWKPDLVNKLLETQKLDELTQALGIKGVDHYQGLLARNACHFAPYSWYRWQSSYLVARDLAQRAHNTSDPNKRAQYTHEAWVYVGYADHFLQDSFAAGHLVNKTLIMQWFIEWAADQSTVPVADWDLIKNMTTSQQPYLAGRKLYDPTYNGRSNDPQTAEDQASYFERLETTGLVVGGNSNLDIAYQNYFSFLGSVITQSSSAYIHDYYNANSLWVGSAAHPTAYEVWGDDTLLSGSNGGDGAKFTGEASKMSRESILQLLQSGQTNTTAQQIRDHFPTTVRANNKMISLEAWNDTQKAFCAANVFPKLHDIIVRAASPRIPNVSQDQDLTPRWDTSLTDAGFTVTTTLYHNGRLYAGSNGYVYQLDLKRGTIIHKLRVTSAVGVGDYETNLATDGNTLFVGTHGYVYGIQLSDWSKVKWEASLSSAGYTVVDVLYANGRLYAGSAGYVYDINPNNGHVDHKLKLRSLFGSGDYTTRLAIKGNMLYAGTHGYVYGIKTNHWSSTAWEASLPKAGYTLVDVIVHNSNLFAGSNGYAYQLNPNSGHVDHSMRVTGPIGAGDYTTRLAANNETLFVGVHGYVYGIKLSNWSKAWEADMKDNRYTNVNVLAIGDTDTQLLASSYGYIYRVDPTNGEVIRQVLLASAVGTGNYETRSVTDDGTTLYTGSHGYTYSVSLNDEDSSGLSTGWNSAPKLTKIGAVQQGGNQRLQLWGADLNRQLRSTYQTEPNNGWSNWSGNWHGDSPENIIDITAAQQADGRVQLWVLTADNTLHSTYQTAPGNGWSDWNNNWHDAPKLQNIAAVQQGGNQRLQLWGTDLNGHLRSIYQTKPSNGWSKWSGNWHGDSPENIIDITAAQQADGRVQLWALTTDNTLHSIYQTAPGNGWSDWNNSWHDAPKLQNIAAVQQGGNQRLQLWGTDLNGHLRSIYQTKPSNGWSKWSGNWHGDSPDNVIDITAAQQNDGCVQLWVITADNTLYSTYQTSPGGGWVNWTS